MEEELEILESIYYDDILKIDITSPNPYVEIFLHPSSDDDMENNKLIKLIMKAWFPPDYPNSPPSFEFSAAKGMTDDDFRSIQQEVVTLARSIKGEPMLFEIIQFVKDKLSDFGNLPETFVCAICLCCFEQSAEAYNLQCYHYFHINCLHKHLSYMEEDITKERLEAERNRLQPIERKPNCPECRTELTQAELDFFKTLDVEKFETEFDSTSIVISNKVRSMQKRMKKIFERQKDAGGIIDTDKQEIITLTREPIEENLIQSLSADTENLFL